MGFGMGAGIELGTSVSDAPNGGFPAYLYGLPSAESLLIDDLLDFSNHELFPSASAATTVDRLDTHVLPPPEPFCTDAGSRDFSSGDGDDSSSDQLHPHASSTFADDLCVPCDEAAELEWLSQFVEDSFSDAPYPSCSTGHLLAPSADVKPRAGPSSTAGRGARRKRSRAFVVGITNHNHHQLATTWSSLAPPPSSSYSTTSSSSSSDLPFPNPDWSGNDSSNSGSRRKKGGGVGGARRCTHCASEKTPQWRTGPLGPKTLCNACGVRYKSGRLVPEYRPAASPSFVLTQHSNSHRKVMELRRQNDLLLRGHDNHPAAAARPGVLFPPSTTARSPPPSENTFLI